MPRDVRYAYSAGSATCCTASTSICAPGERVAVVGPSGAGKSTLGRLLAGIHPPRTGRVDVGGVRLVDLQLETLRREVALVTQEQHLLVGSFADNLRLARVGATDEESRARCSRPSTRSSGRATLPERTRDRRRTPAAIPLSPPQQQQVALARLVLADPHTLVLDEATSLLDPRAARHLERSLAYVLDGGTVVAIAHRLHTAHDADRVAVVEDGLLQRARDARGARRAGWVLRGAVGLVAPWSETGGPDVLYRPEAFEPLTQAPWEVEHRCVRGSVRAIVADADEAFDPATTGPPRHWGARVGRLAQGEGAADRTSTWVQPVWSWERSIGGCATAGSRGGRGSRPRSCGGARARGVARRAGPDGRARR